MSHTTNELTSTVTSTPSITLYSLSDYNNGDLIPFTIDLDVFNNRFDFLEEVNEQLQAITSLRNDAELREEWIVADYENIPSDFVGEYDIDDQYFEIIEAASHSHLDIDVFIAGHSLGVEIDKIEGVYHGEWANDEDFAYDFAESTGAINDDAAWPYLNIDWERAAEEHMQYYIEFDGHYFSANW